MPLYEYACDACGERYELIRKFSDPPLEVCPKCGQGPVRKLVSSPAFHLKGSGWYKTDYAAKPTDSEKPASSAKDGTDTSTGKAASPAKSDTPGAAGADKPAADKPAATSTSSSTPEKT